jgi:N-acetylglucosamine-6-phosphate deacetylase
VLGRLRSWLQILSADPNTPPTTLRNIKLLIAQKELLTVDEIDMITYSPEIDKTLEEVELLSNDIDVEFADTNVDWFLKIWIYQQAQDTPAKERALRACHMMYQQSGMQQISNQIDDTSAIQGATSKFIENEGKQSLQQPF